MTFRKIAALVTTFMLAGAASSASAQLAPIVQETGQISLSCDGNGTNSASGGVLQVDKPAGATVRGAYFFAASNFFRVINDGDISLAGVPLTWDASVFNGGVSLGATFFHNVEVDVTSIVKPIVDAAPAGLVDIAVKETVGTSTIDGSVLAVIFDDPNVPPPDNTIILLFGGQLTDGDEFNIQLAVPFELFAPSAAASMGLGISFGHQGFSGTNQISEIDVNGLRLTSSAGGEDDGESFDGALLTVGGIGDSLDNPPPFAPSSGMFTDDELYDLLPFVTDGDEQIGVSTLNPSDDDNIFCGYFDLSVPAGIGGILLSPVSASKSLGDVHTVTAKVFEEDGDRVQGSVVDFTVLSGPNAGKTGSDVTDANGEATFSYTGDGGVGTDQIEAETAGLKPSNTVSVDWELSVGTIDNGCPGTNGTPVLSVTGTFEPDSITQVGLFGGLENAPAALLVGFEEASLIRNGCTLLFQPQWSLPFLTNASGAFSAQGRWPAGLPSDLSVFFQAYVLDDNAPATFATSNTVLVKTP